MAQYMKGESHKGLSKDTRGVKHQLLVDRAGQTNHHHCTACIDYNKANNSMPNAWSQECLKLYKINRTLRAFIQNSMGCEDQLGSQHQAHCTTHHQVCYIARGCSVPNAVLNPLSQTAISHLLYMDDKV